jgi:hypothetical protein
LVDYENEIEASYHVAWELDQDLGVKRKFRDRCICGCTPWHTHPLVHESELYAQHSGLHR